jgi:CheY-like chemotaxis protein
MLEAPLDRRDRDHARDAFAVRLDGRHVLVVDDDEATRELLAGLIERAGGEVTTAESTSSALDAVHRKAPDAIIADIGMPGEDGRALLRRIRELPPPVGAAPAIALSAYTRAEDQESALRAGFTSFIAKPATPQQLLRALDELMNASEG